jgi:hypothetical protein
MDKWYQKDYTRLLVDMHIPDWTDEFLAQFSTENYFEMMKLAGIDAAEMYAGSCLGLCNWPTKVGIPHKYAGPRDLIAENLKACGQAEITPVVYLNVWCRRVYDEHPEWRLVLPDGQGTVEHYHQRYGICCPNTGFGKYFIDLVDELNRRSDCQCIWIDMIGPLSNLCYCPSCRERFQSETGKNELPEVIDWSDPVWREFQNCRERWFAEFAAAIRSKVQEATPGRSVVFNGVSILHNWYGANSAEFVHTNDFLSGDFTGDAIHTSMVCKLLNSLTPNRPVEFMTPRCESLAFHTSSRTEENLRIRAFAALANQCSFTLIDAIDPSGTLNPAFYRIAGRVNAAYKAYHKYFSPKARPLVDTAIYYSFNATRDYRTKPVKAINFINSNWERNEHLCNLIRLLQRGKLVSGFVAPMYPERLNNAPLILLPNAGVMSEEEAALLREFTAAGGKLVALADSSLFDPDTGMLPDFRLADVFGVHYDGSQTGDACYFDFKDGVQMMLKNARMTRITADDDCEILATLTYPWSEPDELEKFGSAISCPPHEKTDIPTVTRHRYGKGECLYIAGDISVMSMDFTNVVCSDLVKQLVTEPLVISNVPDAVEITIYEDDEKYLVSLLNYGSEFPPPPRFDLEISIKLPVPQHVTLAVEERKIEFKIQNGRIELALERLDDFAMLVFWK